MERERLITSKRKDMTNREYTAYARSEASTWGNSVPFWIRTNNPKEAARKAKMAARWAYKVIGRE